jgi:hypothetical protein
MFDGKFISTLIALVVAVLAICNFNTKKVTSHEGYLGNLPSMTWKKDRVVASSKEAAAKGDFYSIPGTYQSILNPRFSNVQYGANIKYNMPSYENLAVPCEPLTFGSMARENFTTDATTESYGCGSCGGGCGAAGCLKGGAPKSFHSGTPPMHGDYTSGNYNDVVNQALQGAQYPDATDMVPVGDMTTVNALGETVQPIVYDRFIYANRNSRLRGLGDPIRGDLPIVPCAADWFRPSVHPSIDLQEGAMNVIAGVDNGTTRALTELINATSGDTTIAGVDVGTMKNTMTGQAMSTLDVTAFP